MFTDDATLTIAQTCQIENWFVHSRTMNQATTFPACNPTGNFEVTGGLTATNYKGASKQEQIYLLQGKTLFVPLDPDHRYGVGFSAGIDRPHRNTVDNHGDNFAYIPFSISSASQEWTTDLNLGWRQIFLNNKNTLTWGAGTTYSPNDHLSIFSEIFGDNQVKPTLHSGVSIGLIPNILQLDMTYGDDLSVKKDGGFFTVGLNYYMMK
jgi:hypothetical protein